MPIIDRTIIESADARHYLVTLTENSLTVADVTSLDDIDAATTARTWLLSSLASVSGALSIDAGRGMYLDVVSMANLKQWARI